MSTRGIAIHAGRIPDDYDREKQPVVKGILIAYNYRTQWGFAYTDTMTGDTVRGLISGGESNIEAIRLELNGGSWPSNPKTYSRCNVEIQTARYWKLLTSDFPYAGCVPKDLADFIRQGLAACAAQRQAAK